MTELLSALAIALETSLPERVARGETSVDQFLDSEGFSLVELSRDIEQVVLQHNDLKTLLGQNDHDPRFVFSDPQLLNELIAIVSSESENNAVMMSAGGLGRNIQATNLAAVRSSLSKTNRTLDPSKFERAESLTTTDLRSDFKERSEAPRMGTNDTGWRKEYSNHSNEINDYVKLYKKARKELEKTTLKTIEVSIAKDIIHYQISRYISGYKRALASRNRNQWSDFYKTSPGHYYTGHSLTGNGYVSLSVYNDHGKAGYTWGGQYTYEDQQLNKQVSITVSKRVGQDWTIYWSKGNYMGTEFKNGKFDVSNQQILEKTSLYNRDKKVVDEYHQGDLLPAVLKERFGRILALSAIAYNMKRSIAIEKKYWPDSYQDIVKVTQKDDWGKLYQYSRTGTHRTFVWFTKDQKAEAKELRMLYGVQLELNKTEKMAVVNAERVYNRFITDGLSGKQAKRLANLTYFSDIVLFDSFLASSDLKLIASSKLSRLSGASTALSLMTYGLMPFVIRRQIHVAEHILNLEKIDARTPKLASALLTYDLFKNKCLTVVLSYSYGQYEKYLKPDPIHRVLRYSKNGIKKVTHALDKWVFDPLIGGAITALTFGTFHGKFLTKAFNGAIGFTESLGFAIVHGLKTLPKHIYKDTKTLSHQLGRIFTGQATWKGTWDALGRDTKSTRHLVKFAGKLAFDVTLGPLWYLSHGKEDPIGKTIGNLIQGITTGISAARHKFEIKKAEAIAHAEMKLHHRLHEWAPNVIRSPYQLFSSHNKYAQKFNGYVSSVITNDKAFLKANKFKPKELHKGIESQKQQITKDVTIIKGYDLQKMMSHYMWNNLSSLKSQLGQINERQVSRFDRQIKLLRYSNTHSKALGADLTVLALTQRGYKRLQKYLYDSITTQISNDWKNTGKTYFYNLFIEPIKMTLPLPKKMSVSETNDIKHFQSIYRHNKIGKKLFSDILLGDLAARLVQNKTVDYVYKTATAELKTSLHGELVLHLLKWDTRNIVSRINLLLSVGQHSVSEKEVQQARLDIKKATKAYILSNLYTGLTNLYAGVTQKDKRQVQKGKQQVMFAVDDCKWIHHTIKHQYLKKRKARITNKANNHSTSVDASWRKETSIINHGGTVTVGSLVNSLAPSDDDWKLTIKKPEELTPEKPEPSTISVTEFEHEHIGENSPTIPENEALKVNLMGFYGRTRIAREKYNWLKRKLKGKETAKEEAKDVESKAEKDVDIEIDQVETSAIDDVEGLVKDTVETEVADAEAIASDVELDILA